jgi:hypothetical protein
MVVSAYDHPFLTSEGWRLADELRVGTTLARLAEPRRDTALGAGLVGDDVSTIEQAGSVECRCLTVEEDQTFTASDLVVHNSLLTSHWFPVWYLSLFPDRRVISASYEADFAASWGRKVRNTVAQHSEALKLEVAEDSAAANRWETRQGGGMMTAGVGGPLTGKGANLLLVDDPVKNAEEAASQTLRDKIWNWWTSTAYTRLEPDGVAVVVMCMTGDTPVTMGDGTRKRLADVRPGDEVLAWKEGRQVVRRVLNWASQGEDDVLELRTGNHRVRANARHPFLVEHDGKRSWVPLCQISRGDKIVCTGHEPHHG